MLSSVALRAGELLIAALVGGGVLVAVAFAGALWLRRMIRRRLEALGLVLAGQARGAAAAAVSAGWRWTWSLRVPDRRWIAVGRARRRLWRAVSSAEHAVAMARRGGVPTGELDALCRQLRRAAASLDRSLAVERHTTAADGGLESVSAQATELVSAANRIQAAAAAALGSSARLAASGLADDVHREAEALAAGMASAVRAAAPGGQPEEPA
jgi:hypothetical protein